MLDLDERCGAIDRAGLRIGQTDFGHGDFSHKFLAKGAEFFADARADDDGNNVERERQHQQHQNGGVKNGARLLDVRRLCGQNKNVIAQVHELIGKMAGSDAM